MAKPKAAPRHAPVRATAHRRDRRRRTTSLPGDNETLYRDFFENANDACAVFTPDGVILAVNGGAERLLGWSREELIRPPCPQSRHPRDGRAGRRTEPPVPGRRQTSLVPI